MHKRRKKILGVFVVIFVVAIGVCLGVQSFLSTRETASVARTKTAAKTTDGNQCVDLSFLRDKYGVAVNYEVTDSTLIAHLTSEEGAFTIDNWYFASDSESTTSPFINDPVNSGTLTADNGLDINFRKDSNAIVVLHFILTETDDTCLSYNEASTDENGEKVGPYQFEMTFRLSDLNTTQYAGPNTNYDGICRVIRDGTNYSDYASYLNGVSESDVEQYNGSTNGDAYAHYRTLLPFCFPNAVSGQVPSVSYNYDEETLGKMISVAFSSWKIINSSNANARPDDSDFMKAFNAAKSAAIEAGHSYTIPEGATTAQIKSILSADNKLTCDWKLQPERDEAGNIVDYYVNKDYYHAIQVEEEELTYEHRYEGGTTYTPGGACRRTCEESVVVEYGPPVASKAGLCFEYKVKVTSRVVCKSDVKGLIAPQHEEVCTPTPICNEVSGFENQGGPTEEYDACIQSCDGGKYSQACSNKCYNEVYGEDSEENGDRLALNYEEAVVSPVANNFPGYAGTYGWSGGKIVWNHSGNSATYGRWYEENQDGKTRGDHGTYIATEDGFKRHRYTNGDTCNDPCQWTGCTRTQYLNGKNEQDSYDRNLKLYENALRSCQASASCITKTANFEISVDYLHADDSGNTVKTEIEFPASSLTSGDDSDSYEGSDIFLSDGEGYKGYDGCYINSDAKDWYQAEWSFPGTWINNKTGEISYEDKLDDSSWHVQEDKFCIPLDAQSVNTKWWEWSEVGTDCYTDAEIEEEVRNNYNIHARTTNFGYFGWEFMFDCFYALRNEVCDTSIDGCCNDPTPDPDPECPEGECPGPDTTISTRDYAFRIIDTSDMFPKTSTSTEEDSVGEGYSKTGRTPGYNWNLDGDVVVALNAKNSDYTINPTALIADIQQRQSSIYEGTKYLDYSFVLDTEDLAAIREYNRDKQYTEFDGNTRVKNGVIVYESDLINEYATRQGTPGVNNDGEDD